MKTNNNHINDKAVEKHGEVAQNRRLCSGELTQPITLSTTSSYWNIVVAVSCSKDGFLLHCQESLLELLGRWVELNKG